MRRFICLLAALVVWPCSLLGQEARPSVFAIDTAASLEPGVNEDGNATMSLSADAVVSVGLGRGFEGVVWPVVQRLNSGQWLHDVWMASLRYERPGPIGIRVDAGLVPAPVGLANLTVRRPHLNPTISQPSSLFTALPPLELRGPRANLLGAFYPFGAQVTLSGAHWDSRVALIDTSPLRRRRIIATTNPPRFTNVVVGGGVTPMVGLRMGASVTHGGWQDAGETPAVTSDASATVVTLESEFSFRYTKLAGEWVRDNIETSTGDRVASGWYVQGQQTLAPRWFVAGRVERITSPFVSSVFRSGITLSGDSGFALPENTIATVDTQELRAVESVLGFRITPDVTLRLGHRARRGFGLSEYDHQAAVSLVWWKRWM